MQANLIIVSLLDGKGPTGVETHFNQLISEAETFGIKGEIITPHSHKRLWVRFANLFNRGVKLVSKEYAGLLARWIDGQTIQRRLKEALEQQDPDDPVTIYAQDPLSANFALRIRKNRACRVVAVIHYNVSEAHELAMKGEARVGGRLWRVVMATERQTLLQVDQIIFVSEFMQKIMRERLPELSRIPQTVIPNFVARMPQTNHSPAISADLISIGTLEPRKNQEFLLRVLARANDLGCRYRLTLVGDGPDREKLHSLARELKLENQVRFAGYQKNAARLIPQHRVLVHAARAENMPITLIEALALGRPILAPAVGGITEIYRDAVEGYYWPLDDIDGAAGMLVRVLSDAETYERLSRAALLRYQAKFDNHLLVSRWLTTIFDRKVAHRFRHHEEAFEQENRYGLMGQRL